MTTLTETNHPAEFLLSEGNGEISREQVTLAATTVALVPGQILGKVTASGNFVPYDAEATTGEQTAVAILYGHAPISTDTQDVTVIVRNAEVAKDRLVGLDADAQTDLADLDIIVRG
ncbi:head decoration protein [Allopusillimonas soli]|uniref:Head decoration protein n=1 Tax=Allopusillimonas soli TaxID=659016 RepID=A0A853FLU7_9BURK|nr:head decoration protein [Allopusillimonas soli]NYT38876.1 head decoration protein [Allopusillimonas soli]TEA70125.1 head decoration protein [Allopusillimonas soli]